MIAPDRSDHEPFAVPAEKPVEKHLFHCKKKGQDIIINQ